MPSEAEKKASELDFQLCGYQFTAAPEAARAPRIVRIGLVQNKIIIPTTEPVPAQASSYIAITCISLCIGIKLCFYSSWQHFTKGYWRLLRWRHCVV